MLLSAAERLGEPRGMGDGDGDDGGGNDMGSIFPHSCTPRGSGSCEQLPGAMVSLEATNAVQALPTFVLVSGFHNASFILFLEGTRGYRYVIKGSLSPERYRLDFNGG